MYLRITVQIETHKINLHIPFYYLEHYASAENLFYKNFNVHTITHETHVLTTFSIDYKYFKNPIICKN